MHESVVRASNQIYSMRASIEQSDIIFIMKSSSETKVSVLEGGAKNCLCNDVNQFTFNLLCNEA